MEEKKRPSSIDEYIKDCPEDIQILLQKVRQAIHEVAPQAMEKISWAMPTFYLKGNLIHFTAHKQHIGIYPGVKAVEYFASRLTKEGYKYSKGAIQFPYKKELPLELIKEITLFSVKENLGE